MKQGFTVQVVRIKGRVHWAVKATVGGVSRYRGCYYKKDALLDLAEWEAYHKSAFSDDIFRAREFNHNFHSAEELNIIEVK